VLSILCSAADIVSCLKYLRYFSCVLLIFELCCKYCINCCVALLILDLLNSTTRGTRQPPYFCVSHDFSACKFINVDILTDIRGSEAPTESPTLSSVQWWYIVIYSGDVVLFESIAHLYLVMATLHPSDLAMVWHDLLNYYVLSLPFFWATRTCKLVLITSQLTTPTHMKLVFPSL